MPQPESGPITHPFTHPFMYWVGMDTDPRTTPEALAEFNQFYNTTHVGEVLTAHPGFVTASRYELIEPDPRGGMHAGPRWLAVYEMTDEVAAQQYIKDNARPWLHRQHYSPWPAARKKAKTTWRMLWRQLSATGSTDQAPESIFLVGMNIPADTDAEGLDEFNAFYTQTHVPEVMANGGYSRATRFELYRQFAHPAPGSPRFCAIYEADKVTTTAREARLAVRPALSSGPSTWEKHDTLWRLVYRRIALPE
ncbi:MAG TPA: hypothetical protein VGQ62_01260 [Chloroflexota bacterium]|jgi:hypothetical protein|nr:hypothetical protein [Chloroflexota bacterium]